MSIDAKQFAVTLRDMFDARRAEAHGTPGVAEWSVFMFDVLCKIARGRDLIPCGKGGSAHGGENREYLWDFTMYDAHDEVSKRWGLPCVVIEHENHHHVNAFREDFWKTLCTHSPLRVAIGYCATADVRDDWVKGINDIAEQHPHGWDRAFVDGTEDLIALGFYRMTEPGQNFRFWLRSGTARSWEELKLA